METLLCTVQPFKTKWKCFAVKRPPISEAALLFRRFPCLAHLSFR